MDPLVPPTVLTKLAVYNPASNTWTGVTSAAPDTWNAGTEAEYLDGRIYVWRGGFAGGAVNGADSYLDVYEIAMSTWSRTPSLRDRSPTACIEQFMVALLAPALRGSIAQFCHHD